MSFLVVLILTLGSICASAGTVMLKLGATGRISILSFLNGWIVSGLLLYGLGAAFWIYGLSRNSLVSVYPFSILNFVIIYAVGIFWLGEQPSRSALLGVLFILVGLYFVTSRS